MIPLTIVLIALAVVYVGACFLVELEFFGWATVVLIATVAGVQWLNVFDIMRYVADNLLTSTLYVLGYLVVGIIWSFLKWFSYLMKFRDKFRETKTAFLIKRGVHLENGQPLPYNTAVPEHLKQDFAQYLREQYAYKTDYLELKNGQKPVASKNKKKITAWMAFWPCSVISTLLNDPVRRVFRFLFNLFKGLYQKLADTVFANDPDLK